MGKPCLRVDASAQRAGSGYPVFLCESAGEGVHAGTYLAAYREEWILARHVRRGPLQVQMCPHDIQQHPVQVQVQLALLVGDGIHIEGYPAPLAQPFIVDEGVRHLQMGLDAGEAFP